MARFMEKMKFTAISRLAANASWSGFSAGEDKQVAIYNPPAGWVILSTETVVHSSSNGSRAVSTVAGGLNLATESLLDAVYTQAIDAAAKYKDKEITAKLKLEKNNRINEVRKWSSNKNTIIAEVSCKAHGSALDRKRGWEEISVNAELLFLGESSRLSLISEIEQAYRIDVDSMVPSQLALHGLKMSNAGDDVKDPDDLDLAERSEVNVVLPSISNEPATA